MKLTDYRTKMEKNPEYQQAVLELRFHFALGDAVLHARLDHGWTQTELARRVGTRQANISRIEDGLANPTLNLIQRIMDVLELDMQFRHYGQKTDTKVLVIEVPVQNQNQIPFSRIVREDQGGYLVNQYREPWQTHSVAGTSLERARQ